MSLNSQILSLSAIIRVNGSRIEGPGRALAKVLRFYAVPRGHHPNARSGFTDTSMLSMMQFSCLQYIDEISPRPILFVAGDIAHSRSFSERACAMAAEPKELFIVEGAEHIDLYDRTDLIPFDKLESFFSENM